MAAAKRPRTSSPESDEVKVIPDVFVRVDDEEMTMDDVFEPEGERLPSGSASSSVSDGELKMFAFNVGQANFSIIQKGNRLVIIVAGGSLSSETKKLMEEVLKGRIVVAVFVTHPHEDHFNLFIDPVHLGKRYSESFVGCKFYLSGSVWDWTSGSKTENKARKDFVSFLEENGYEVVYNPLGFESKPDWPFNL